MVVGDLYIPPVGVANDNALLILVYPCHLTHEYCRVLLIPKDVADWCRNLTACQYRGCHLVKQRLKQMVIGTVDQGYFPVCLPQSFGGKQASETAADDHYMWRLMCHDLQSSGVCLCRQHMGLLSAQRDEIDQQLVLFLLELLEGMVSSHLRNAF